MQRILGETWEYEMKGISSKEEHSENLHYTHLILFIPLHYVLSMYANFSK